MTFKLKTKETKMWPHYASTNAEIKLKKLLALNSLLGTVLVNHNIFVILLLEGSSVFYQTSDPVNK